MSKGRLERTKIHQTFSRPTGEYETVTGYFGLFTRPIVEEYKKLYHAQCQDCGALYPIIDGFIKCNNKIIARCLCANV